MEEILIRSAQASDLDVIYNQICELEEEKLNKKVFEEIFKENLNKEGTYYLIAEYNGEVVGFISLYIQKLLHHGGSAAEIQELFVDPNIRGRGIGSKLIEYAKSIADKNDSEVFEVACNLKREKTHEFYEREGLHKTHYKFTSKPTD